MKLSLASINLCLLPSHSGLHLHTPLKCRANKNIIPKRTANITRMRTTLLESGFRNFDSH